MNQGVKAQEVLSVSDRKLIILDACIKKQREQLNAQEKVIDQMKETKSELEERSSQLKAAEYLLDQKNMEIECLKREIEFLKKELQIFKIKVGNDLTIESKPQVFKKPIKSPSQSSETNIFLEGAAPDIGRYLVPNYHSRIQPSPVTTSTLEKTKNKVSVPQNK